MTELVRSEPVIQAAKVTKYFGEDCVLKEADLILRKGEVCGIVGNNGSGKTVLMKCIFPSISSWQETKTKNRSVLSSPTSLT